MEIEVKSVWKTIKRRDIVCDVSFTMKSGIVYGLKGVNGSGKTMLMRLLAGLIKPSSGSITMDGKILGKDISFPQDVGLLIENPAFLESYTGYENLKLLGNIREKIADSRISEVLNEVGLDPQDTRKYRQYSLGMKQRLGIAGAVLEHPALLLIDEPTNALDTTGVEMLKKIVMGEKNRGALIVLACHDFEILKELSDRIYLVEEGYVKLYEEENAY